MKPAAKYIIPVVLCVWFCPNLQAQTQNPRYNFKHLNVQNGLAQNIVYHFLQDSRGYMWIGTRNGLTLYDGSRTVNFLHDEDNKRSLANNFITRIIEDGKQQVWVGTDVGLSLYNRQDNSFSNFSVLKDKAAFCVPLGFASGDELWLLETETKSIRVFNTRTKTTDSISSTPAVDGAAWFDSLTQTRHIWTYLSSGTIHYVFKNRTLVKKETFFSAENKKYNEPTLQVVHALRQNDSTVWLSTTSGLVELNPLSRKYIIHSAWGKTQVKELRYVALSPTGMLWVATGNSGIYTFNPITKKFIDNFSNYQLDPSSICSNNIVSLNFDRVGNLWCGSYGQGASYTSVDKNYFLKSLAQNEFEKWKGNNDVHWVGYDKKNNLWCITNDDAGFWELDKEKHLTGHREPVLENGKKFTGRFYKLLFEDDRYAWAIGREGLFHYDIARNLLIKMAYPFFSSDLFGSNWVQDIIELQDGSFLFSTFAGLYRIKKNNSTYHIEPFSELNKKPFTSFAALHQDEKGSVYVKDQGNRFYILEMPKGEKNVQNIRSHAFIPQVNQFFNDTAANRVLLATSFGLYELNRNNNDLKKIQFETGPPFLSINSLLKTGDKLWLFGDKGLFCYDEKLNTTRRFTVDDGLPSNEFNISATLISSNECIAGTNNGLVSFYPYQLQDKIYPPLVQLINIHINDSAAGFIPNPQETSKISLSHSQNTFSFEFAPISFQNAAACSFEYKLQGYDADWIRSGNTWYTRYSKIPPGDYVFHLRAIDANGIVSPHDKILEIEIAKAFWQTTIFKIAVASLVLVLVWFAIKWWLNQKIRKHKLEFEKQQAIEKERTRIATDMHDDLGAGLSKIRFLSETVQRTISGKEHQPDLQNISSSSVELVDKFNEIIWAMNEKNNSLEDLLYYIRNYTAKYCEENGLMYKISLPEHINGVIISGEFRRHLFLTVKECLHNVVKHARAGNVSLSVELDTAITIKIRDDGKGFDIKTMNNKGNGLRNMQQRIQQLDGQLDIEAGNGTMIKITVPFP